jgi:lysophospholipase L1-like esterase
MKRGAHATLVTVLLVILAVLSAGCASDGALERKIPDDAVVIASVGDSITYGTLITDRNKNSYPAQLQRMLGDGFFVVNYGVSGRTMLDTADKPYRRHRYFEESHRIEPDIVVIMLGTNDTKRKNWTDLESYVEACRAMVESYRSLPSRPCVVLLTPPAAFGDSGPHRLRYGMDRHLVREIGHAIRNLGEELRLPVVDIFAATENHREYFLADGIHPNREGAHVIALAVEAAVSHCIAGF